ncbi:MAG: hypothetical protein NTW21_16075 [Verrucomicrobia bacterium]|nr:hypothetical protein [Verrucomicrobiota bacterium]
MSATLGRFHRLGLEPSDPSSDKKRLASLGAERLALPQGQGVVVGIEIVGFMPVEQRRFVRR